MKTIIFDASSITWNADVDYNQRFLYSQENYIKNLFNHRGYIYLNQIYECFGVKWDPKLEHNLCYLVEYGPINLEFEGVDDNKILIHINH